MATKTDLEATKASPLALPAELTDMITSERPKTKDEGTLGTESIGADDIVLPRLGLAQKMSPEIDETKADRCIPGLKFMDMFNSLTRQPLGRGPLHFFIVKRMDEPRWIEFNPIETGGGIKDRHVYRGDPRTEFQPDGRKPIATMFLDYYIVLLNGMKADAPEENVLALSLKGSGIRAAHHLNFLISLRGQKQICKGVYSVETGHETDKKSGGTYAVYKFKNAGWLKEGSPLEALAVDLFEAWKDKQAAVDDDTMGAEDVAGDTSFDTSQLERA